MAAISERDRVRSTHTALLVSEAAMLRRLTDAVDVVLAHHRATTPARTALDSQIVSAAEALRRHLPAVLAASKMGTRSAALDTVWNDLAALRKARAARGEPDDLPAAPLPQPSDSMRDLAAGDSLAGAFSLAAGSIVAGQGAKQMRTADVISRAVDKLLPNLQRLAATENATAFNQARLAAVAHVTGAVLRWDATLDSKTCGDCRELDGTESPAARGFVVPSTGQHVYHAPLHPHCRCVAILINQ